jgi:hypothetical protein
MDFIDCRYFLCEAGKKALYDNNQRFEQRWSCGKHRNKNRFMVQNMKKRTSDKDIIATILVWLTALAMLYLVLMKFKILVHKF